MRKTLEEVLYPSLVSQLSRSERVIASICEALGQSESKNYSLFSLRGSIIM